MIIGQIWASSKAAASIAHQLQVQVSIYLKRNSSWIIFSILVTSMLYVSTMCLYFGGYSHLVASLHSEMLLLELIPGATRPSTENNNNNNVVC